MSKMRFTIASSARAVLLGVLLSSALVSSCATEAGDDIRCPTCNNTTEVLVGTRCVPLAEVAACGPDGHAHGTECHCLSGQAPTAIGGVEYCLQLSCGTAAIDTAAVACDEVTRAPESVTAVATLAEVESAHVGVGKVTEVILPAGPEGFVHFEADEAGEMLVYASAPGVIQAALTVDGTPLVAALEGANEDCASALPEVWGVQVTMAGPVVLRLATGTVASVKLVIQESGHVR
jgi:hypothetical protein